MAKDKGARGPKGIPGPAGPAGKTGAVGKTGARGAKGAKGTHGSAGKSSATTAGQTGRGQLIADVNDHIDGIYQELSVQMKRMAQIQVQVDELRAKVKALTQESN